MRSARGLLAAALVVALAGCGSAEPAGDSPTPTGTTEQTPPASATDLPADAPAGSAVPAVGDCYTLSSEELERATTSLSTSSTAVECGGEHNAVTVEVVGLADKLASLLDGPASAGTVVDPLTLLRVNRELGGLCAPPTNQALGGAVIETTVTGVEWARVASTLTTYAWLPSAEQWAAGERWVRCDLASSRGTPLPGDGVAFDLSTVPADLALCVNVNLEGFVPMDCTDPDATAQGLVHIAVDDATLQSALAAHDAFQPEADGICQTVAAQRFPDAQGVSAALPIESAFTGELDCIVPHTPGEPPLVTTG